MSVVFQNVYKTLRQKKKKTKVFEAVDVTFSADRITGILAAAGAGKTTAADLTTGKLRPDFGRVKRSSLVSFPVGGGGVFNNLLTGRENLAFLCRVFGFDPRPIIRFVIEFAELGKAIDKPFRLYNRDERTRFIYASSYAIPFDTYVVDESLIGGRGDFRDQCTGLVQQRMETAGFIIYTSSPTVLRKYCNEFYVVDKMGIQQVSTCNEAISLLGEAKLRDGDGTSDEAAGGEIESVNPG